MIAIAVHGVQVHVIIHQERHISQCTDATGPAELVLPCQGHVAVSRSPITIAHSC